MSFGSEKSVVQESMLKYAQEAGWEYLAPEEALRLRRGETGLLLYDIFITKTQQRNPRVVDFTRAEELIKDIERIYPGIEGNLASLEYLKGLRTVFVPEEKRERNAALIDFNNPDNNRYHVTEELLFYNGTHRIRADLIFFINGLPVIIVETKSAKRAEAVDEALEQLRRYHREGPELLSLLQLFNLTNLLQYYYGATWNLCSKTIFNWKEDSTANDFESLVKSFVHPQRILRVISDFILFTRKDEELTKVVLRPHQMRATEKAVQRAAEEEKRRGLIWHTQGSGKTFTMITIASLLIEDPLFENPTVLMLVDRNELEAQLYGNLTACDFSAVNVADSKKDLQNLLASDQRGLIVSMIHKFEDMPENINERQNVFVLVDEAHRTTGGDLGNYLMGALPNATYLGFTGTPIDKTAYGKGTFKIFGTEDPQGYLDKYSIAESIEDGATVPLHYSLAPSDLSVDKETLNKDFLEMSEVEGVSDVDVLNKTLEKAVNLKNMLKNEERVDKIAQHVADHYRKYIEPMGYKAFLVGVDREACALYKEALDKYLPPEYSEVVFSAFYNDPPELSRYHLGDKEEKEVRKRFRNPKDLPKVLIVTEKLLTGYDAPILYCMYLDKPMRDHVLLQAIARVNRPYEDENGQRKPAGFVLDYVGIFDNLEKALEFDSKDVEGTIQDIDLLKEQFEKLIERARSDYLPLIWKTYSADKMVENVLEHFRDEEKRHQYYKFFQELSEIYEILSPDPFLRQYVDDYGYLSHIYWWLRAYFEPGVQVDRELARKTALLVREHTSSGVVEDPLEIYEIDDKLLKRLREDKDTSDTVKIFNVLKSVQEMIKKQGHTEPYLISIGERAERVVEEYKERQRNAPDTLVEIENVIKEICEAKRARAEKNLNEDAFTLFWVLKQTGIEEPEEAAKQMENVFNSYPHWKTTDAQAREVRKELYKTLKDKGVEDKTALAKMIIQHLRREAS